jgi:hypothetical protein
LTRLRQVVVGIGLVAVAAAGWSWFSGHRNTGLVELGVYAVVALVLLAIERAHYKPILKAAPGAPWRETPERFIDPESGKLVVVWVHPKTGGRAYVEAGG